MGKNWLDTASITDIVNDLLEQYERAQNALVCEYATHVNLDKDLAELKTECAEYRTRIEQLKIEASKVKALAEIGAAVSKMEIGHSLNHDLAYVTLVDAVGGWQVVDEYDAMGRAEILGKGPTLRDALVESGMMEVNDG